MQSRIAVKPITLGGAALAGGVGASDGVDQAASAVRTGARQSPARVGVHAAGILAEKIAEKKEVGGVTGPGRTKMGAGAHGTGSAYRQAKLEAPFAN